MPPGLQLLYTKYGVQAFFNSLYHIRSNDNQLYNEPDVAPAGACIRQGIHVMSVCAELLDITAKMVNCQNYYCTSFIRQSGRNCFVFIKDPGKAGNQGSLRPERSLLVGSALWSVRTILSTRP